LAFLLGGCSAPEGKRISWVFTPRAMSQDSPDIQITDVSIHDNRDVHSYTISVSGRTANLDARYKVAIYIHVDGHWWPKPTWAKPFTGINEDGKWVCKNVDTGFADSDMDAVTAILVRKDSEWEPHSTGLPDSQVYTAIDQVEKKLPTQ